MYNYVDDGDSLACCSHNAIDFYRFQEQLAQGAQFQYEFSMNLYKSICIFGKSVQNTEA